MTDDRSLERAARSFIESGPTRAPDRAVEAALLRIDTTSQVRGLWVPWRFVVMNKSVGIAVGATAILGIALLAAALAIGRPEPSVGNPPSSPASSPTMTATTSPAPSIAALSAGPLTAGRYTTQSAFPLRITVTVPDGWQALAASPSTVSILQSGNGENAAFLGFWIVETAHRDPCDPGGVADTPVGPTAGDLAAALAGSPGFDATGPTAVSVDGVEGEFVELIGPHAGCTDPEPALWLTPDGSCRCMNPAVERNRLWILEVDGNRLVIDALDIPASEGVEETSIADLAELQGIIDSIEISR
jgi:hypothetical protein